MLAESKRTRERISLLFTLESLVQSKKAPLCVQRNVQPQTDLPPIAALILQTEERRSFHTLSKCITSFLLLSYLYYRLLKIFQVTARKDEKCRTNIQLQRSFVLGDSYSLAAWDVGIRFSFVQTLWESTYLFLAALSPSFLKISH